ncbi:uncharacterized protein LOC113561296 [Rhopalosiphum maidis]|uniref:uncharacterized protein LOC113561296 n=1 Tax=Rhopalosiphum maidis TaxID=43146 RepID=UPI000F006A86|nr:uncharacterized protein LOC113561296 [Rhopalosiphum maidis]
MRFSFAVISAFAFLVVINVSYVNAKHVATSTDGKIRSTTTLEHADQTKAEHTTLKKDHDNKSSSTLIPQIFTPFSFIRTTPSLEEDRDCPNGYYYHELYGCVKIYV